MTLIRAFVAALLACAAAMASADTYPDRPITLIVPFAAGGNNDVSGRLIAQQLGEALKQQVVVENRTGAAGAIGAAAVAHAKPDGYTLGFMSSGPLAGNVSLYKQLPYDPLKNLTAIARTTTSPSVLVVHPSVPVSTLAEFVAYAKAHPRKLNYGTSGNGSSPHLAAALFESMAGVEMVNVPYRGGNQVNADLLSGELQLSFSPILEVVPHIQAGKLKAIAVTSAARSKLLPQTPAVAEAFPGYEVLTWNGIVAPAGTPRAIVDKLQSETQKLLSQPAVQDRLLQLGLEPAPSSSSEFASYIDQQIKAFAKLVQLAGVDPQ